MNERKKVRVFEKIPRWIRWILATAGTMAFLFMSYVIYRYNMVISPPPYVLADSSQSALSGSTLTTQEQFSAPQPQFPPAVSTPQVEPQLVAPQQQLASPNVPPSKPRRRWKPIRWKPIHMPTIHMPTIPNVFKRKKQAQVTPQQVTPQVDQVGTIPGYVTEQFLRDYEYSEAAFETKGGTVREFREAFDWLKDIGMPPGQIPGYMMKVTRIASKSNTNVKTVSVIAFAAANNARGNYRRCENALDVIEQFADNPFVVPAAENAAAGRPYQSDLMNVQMHSQAFENRRSTFDVEVVIATLSPRGR